MMTPFLKQAVPSEVLRLEKHFLERAEVAEGWKLIEAFASLVRESGSAGEWKAAEILMEALGREGVPVELYEPELLISLPRRARLRVSNGKEERSVPCKTPSFSLSCWGQPRRGKLLYLPSEQAREMSRLFDLQLKDVPESVRGRIVLTEGFPMPTLVRTLQEREAAGLITIHPGRHIHEMICTTIWGCPGSDNIHRKPRIPVVGVNRPEGDRLIAWCRQGELEAAVETELEEGWRRCALPVARIEGREEPFLLVHGHYDSWHVGIGDNATGDALLLELARALYGGRKWLRRSVWLAWWPGHSTGRYAGSTWFADRFALELHRHAIAHVNVDSPGCRGATSFEEVMWMAECGDLCRWVIREQTGQTPARLRPLRAGDYSFNQLGLSAFYMLLSSRPKEELARLGYYPVGGCGGDIAWHTEEDTLEVADREILRRDLLIYLKTILRFLNARILPLDFRHTCRELLEAAEQYQAACGDRFSLQPTLSRIRTLQSRLGTLYAEVEAGSWSGREAKLNALLLALSRILVPLGYALGEEFDHDPAEQLGVLPKLQETLGLAAGSPGSEQEHLLRTRLVRQQNKVCASLERALGLLEEP